MTPGSRTTLKFAAPALILLLVSGCSLLPSSGPEFATLEGQADSEERMTLPSNAEFDVALIDTTAGRTILATANQPDPGQLPLHFTLQYDRSALDAEHDYALDASVRVDGRLRYINVDPVAVLTKGAPRNHVTLELERVN